MDDRKELDMQSIFDEKWNRTGTGTIKWKASDEGRKDIIPMGIADMEFATAPCVIEAVRRRMEHPLFGYFNLDNRFYEAIMNWHGRHFHNEDLRPEHILYQNGVLGGIAAALQAFTLPGDRVLCSGPVYSGFIRTVGDLGRVLCPSMLKPDREGIMRLDLEDMERKILDNKVKAFIFCSPHNPTGRVWDEDEIRDVAVLCGKYHVLLISDEIWADFTPGGKQHIPTAMVSGLAKDITISLYSPTKTFNLASLRCAYAVAYAPWLRDAMEKAAVMTHFNNPNVLSCEALIGAYQEGGEWVEQLNRYIRKNQEYVHDYVTSQFSGVRMQMPEGTYLGWLDCSAPSLDFEQILKDMEHCGVLGNDGASYLAPKHVRLNLACPMSVCEDAMSRLERYVFHIRGERTA